MTLLRTQLGTSLRGHRLRQRRTLRDVSGAARVSLGYLSEVERGQKEASSELLASICEALELELADLLVEVSRGMRSAAVSDAAVAGARTAGAPPADDRSADAAPSSTGTRPVEPAVEAPEPALALVGAGAQARSPARGAVPLAA